MLTDKWQRSFGKSGSYLQAFALDRARYQIHCRTIESIRELRYVNIAKQVRCAPYQPVTR